MGKRILIVEDEKAICDILSFNLKREGYETAEAADGETGLRLALESNPDLILLDVMLPGIDGFEICKTVRAKGAGTPIIMLTAREDETDKVLGLELGADDYITKPFSMRELLARVKANIRRTALDSGAKAPEPADTNGLRIDPERFNVYKNGKRLDLTQREFDLLKFLAASPGTVFSRESLMENVWNYDYYGDLRTVDVTVRRLRSKLEDNPAEPDYILTKHGVGYFFRSEEN
ncbi:response regulator transcription factor [Oscillospiraceae bacterium OttesenSCG-928-F05]|nr:response regulator transcription factor [Oscillospiraceae bacterium OttesenSCG-928-F05]